MRFDVEASGVRRPYMRGSRTRLGVGMVEGHGVIDLFKYRCAARHQRGGERRI